MNNLYTYSLIGTASFLYIIVISFYYFKNYNLLAKMSDFKKLLVGPIFILFIYGLLLSNVVVDPEKIIFWKAAILASAFILYYGGTKIFMNTILHLDNRLVGDGVESQNYI
tara:strand:- start:741 stop:1073 length:333 start_codon:yes stop_codon:yes gene_type:complete